MGGSRNSSGCVGGWGEFKEFFQKKIARTKIKRGKTQIWHSGLYIWRRETRIKPSS